MQKPIITIIYGGISNERDVSLVTGIQVAKALSALQLKDDAIASVLLDVQSAAMLELLDPQNTVVFVALHGAWGEDGQVQQLLESKSFAYTGSDSISSRLCMDKIQTIQRVKSKGVETCPHVYFTHTTVPSVEAILDVLGEDLVLKPSNQGSSRLLQLIQGKQNLQKALQTLPEGHWMIEKRIHGFDISIGVLNGQGLGCVQILPKSGVYDYTSKYTAGATNYQFPAQIDKATETAIRTMAETAFQACGCRDFARADFVLSQGGTPYFLELNTIPALTPTSLLPKSASCFGYDFNSLIEAMLKPAINRFHNNYNVLSCQSSITAKVS
jgi:D-alanine-D-alanine ligase